MNELFFNKLIKHMSILLFILIVGSVGTPLYFGAEQLLTADGMLDTETGETTPTESEESNEEYDLYAHKKVYKDMTTHQPIGTLSQSQLAEAGIVATDHSPDFIVTNGNLELCVVLKMMEAHYNYVNLSETERTSDVTDFYNYIMTNGTGYWMEDTGTEIIEHEDSWKTLSNISESGYSSLLINHTGQAVQWDINAVFQYNGVNYTLDNNHYLWSASVLYDSIVTQDYIQSSSVYNSWGNNASGHPDYTSGAVDTEAGTTYNYADTSNTVENYNSTTTATNTDSEAKEKEEKEAKQKAKEEKEAKQKAKEEAELKETTMARTEGIDNLVSATNSKSIYFIYIAVIFTIIYLGASFLYFKGYKK